ncbi:MAG: rod shape-determining protein MreC [Alphaproteobacteria bacterium]|nr:rod shape-determining protein MreC [Alphaproteobacteria bacterium]MDA7987493.1 rod shape-determining protein MreC [Alphaproteobacteria bacterium]MDA8000359.1 rod shape-determining protein MreC [Alphaproteobacteria bacterium]MDA8004140.1 rod shape-determining protein MreC [Alphaproteobacteria bacterium]MDA8005881.1 rod shape-determining protein MreC [Alphaproteobacteria bacterium]
MPTRRPRTPSRAISSRAPKIITATTIILIASLLIANPLQPNLISRVRTTMLDASSSILQIVPVSPINQFANFTTSLRDASRLRAANAALREDNAKLTRWYGEAQRLQNENNELHALLGVPAASHPERVVAKIIGATGGPFSRSVHVLAGRSHGVNINHIASNEIGVVGRVIEAGERTARVLLFTDISSRVPVYIGDNKQHAILAGNNEPQLTLVHLPQDITAKRGDVVFTSGSGGVFPPHQKIGTVHSRDGNRITVTPFSDARHNGFLILSDPQYAVLRQLEQNP